MPRIRATELWTKKVRPEARVVVLTGEDPFWKAEVLRELRKLLGSSEGELQANVRRFDGTAISWHDFREEIETPSLFAANLLLVVDDADSFVAAYQKELVRFVDSSCPATIILVLRQLHFGSKLAKAVVEKGLWIDCAPAQTSELLQWLPVWASWRYQLRVSAAAARTLIEFVGEDPGVLDQELAKLSLLVGPAKPLTPQAVQEHCLGGRVKTVWFLLDLALEGKLGEALAELHRLLGSGAHPLSLLAQITGSLRRLSLAAELALAEHAGPSGLRRVLQASGVPPSVIPKVEGQLSRLGMGFARRLADILVAVDGQLKGGSLLPERIVLERLLTWLAYPGARTGLGPAGEEAADVTAT
ncbi:MAG: DNA polymerase III subunit delta [Thermoguttaceae bacterium]|nr:DNA polymerase III subunit delta [Thermoguttaceae bacterium]MDW8078814.1 DNA polymerase III subunit delta [Thermoguttaceae bacterium]